MKIFFCCKLAIKFVLLLGVVSACNHSDNASRVKTPLKFVTVGWIGPLTDSANILGIDNLNAVELALSDYNVQKESSDPTIRLIVVDDSYNSKLTVKGYEKILKQNPVAIFVSTYSGVMAIAEMALNDSVMIINPIDNDKKLAEINQNIFLIGKETEGMAGIDANAIIDQGKKNTAVIYYGSDEFMPTLAQALKDILLSYGNAVTLIEYQAGTTDFKNFFETAQAHNVDSYALFGYQEIGLAMKQARKMGIKENFYAVNAIRSQLSTYGENLVNGTYFAHFTSLDGNRVLADEFINKYIKAFGKKPFLDWTAFQAYDAATILFNTIKTVSQEEGKFSENLRNKLLSVENLEGVSGMITILPSGASRGIYPSLYIFKDGKPIRVSSSNN